MFLAAGSPPARAGGVPVHDATAHVARLDQVARLVEQLNLLRGQLDAAHDSLRALTGSGGYGARHPGGLATGLPGGEAAFAALLAGGGEGPAAALRDRLREAFQLEVEAGAGAAGLHNARVRGAHAREALARTTYEEASRNLELVRTLSGEADAADSVKTAIDLQNRLLAQNARSVLAVVQVMAAAEAAEAQRERRQAELALRLRRMAEPRFLNPRLDRRLAR